MIEKIQGWGGEIGCKSTSVCSRRLSSVRMSEWVLRFKGIDVVKCS